MTKILQITSYPTRSPRHGGQLRAHHIARVLEASGFSVVRLAVYSRSHYPAAGEDPVVDLDASHTERRFPEIWPLLDMTTSELVATDEACFHAFANCLQASQSDVLILEEPWLWPAVKRWRQREPTPVPVIFNAYNIEHRAKAAILADANIPDIEGIIAEVDALERDVTQNAFGASATTAEDATVMRAWTEKKIVVARNGTQPRHVEHLWHILPEPLEPWHRFLLFVGSAHPPNAAGFWQMVIPALHVLRTDERIVVCGGVSNLIQSRIDREGPAYLARDRLVLLGPVSNLTLDCLLCNARGILLPITYGGGSNLKTAEALISGLPIVSTSQALRGFGDYVDHPAITMADNPAMFASGIRHVLDGDRGLVSAAALPSLLWENTLQPIVDLVGEATTMR